jgi:predicted nucleic acid-binding protein
MVTAVCVDASLVVRLYLPDERSAAVDTLFSRWMQDNVSLIGPPLLYAETPSILRQAVFLGRIDPELGQLAFEGFCSLGIAIVSPNDLHVRAWELAKEHGQRRIYDSMYLAVAQVQGCDLWTGDTRMANAINLPWVKRVGP